MKCLLIITAVVFCVLSLMLLIRVIKGPTIADRVIAADGIDDLMSLVLALYAIYTGRSIYFDIAIVSTLLGFIATVFVARYLERRM